RRWEQRLVALLQVTAGGDFDRGVEILVQKIEGFSGRIEDAGPSRLVAAFGVEPIEDAPRRAALAAIAAQKVFARAPQVYARRGGRGGIVAVVGEPGIGKSRLLFEFRRSLGEELIDLEGRGESYGAGVPYLPIVDLLKRYFEIDEREDAPAIGEKVTAALRGLDEAFAADVAPVLALLDAPVNDAQWPTFESSQRRQRTLDALKRFVLRLSREKPVLLVVEDLHWIDSETEAFLDRLAGSLSSAPVLVLVSYRPEYRYAVASPTSYTQLHLDPLAPAVAETLLRAPGGDEAALTPPTRR